MGKETLGRQVSLKMARNFTGLSRRKFAAEVGVSESSVQKYEEGKSDIPGKKLLKWCEVAGISILDIDLTSSTEK